MVALSSLCVYTGASGRVDGVHREAAARLGGLMAARGVHLIYGGGRVGLMGVLADAALAAGGRVTGVIPAHIEEAEIAHRRVTNLIVVNSMHERKLKMFQLADAFAVLPGGLGTLDETLEIITWRQLGLHDKPIVLVDNEGYWAPLRRLIDHLVATGFAGPDTERLFTVVDRVDDIFAAVAATRPPVTEAREGLL